MTSKGILNFLAISGTAADGLQTVGGKPETLQHKSNTPPATNNGTLGLGLL